MSANKSKGQVQYHLKMFDASSLEETCDAWQKAVERHKSEVFSTEFDRIIDWVRQKVSYDEPSESSFAYGIFEGEALVASAVVEIIYQRTGRRWLKMLNLHLSPDLDAKLNGDSIDSDVLSGIYSEAIVGTIRLTGRHPTDTVKLYARSATLLGFLRGVTSSLHRQEDLPFDVSTEGRWMVIRTHMG